MKNKNRFRIILIILAIALVAIPIMIVGITGKGFGELVSHILISLSILSAIAAIMLGADKKNKDKFFFKMIVSIALLIVLISIWL
jgi:hypothetical protein